MVVDYILQAKRKDTVHVGIVFLDCNKLVRRFSFTGFLAFEVP